MSDDARAYVTARIADERAQLVKQLKAAERNVKPLNAKYERASKAHDKTVIDLDAPESDKERKARIAKDAALSALQGTLHAIAATRIKIAKLDDPAELDRRVAVKERLDNIGATPTTQEEREMAGTTNKHSEKKVAEITAAVVAAVKETKSFTRAAEKLNADKVPTLGKSSKKGWYTQIVRACFLKTGERVTLKPQRKIGDKPATATVKLDKGDTGNGTTASAGKAKDVKPDPKPKATTGKRATAKRSTATRAATAKRGSTKRSTAKRSSK